MEIYGIFYVLLIIGNPMAFSTTGLVNVHVIFVFNQIYPMTSYKNHMRVD